jgi:hypothetical protein
MLRVSEDIEQIGIPGMAATVFRRATPGSIQHAGILNFRLDGNDLFQIDCVLPVIAEVVGVANLCPSAGQDSGEKDFVFPDDIARLIKLQDPELRNAACRPETRASGNSPIP